MGRWDDIFKLFSIEDVDCNKVTLRMTMLACLGGRNFHNLASSIFDDNVTALADGTSLLRVGLGSSGVGL